jgi:hypothetical protein
VLYTQLGIEAMETNSLCLAWHLGSQSGWSTNSIASQCCTAAPAFMCLPDGLLLMTCMPVAALLLWYSGETVELVDAHSAPVNLLQVISDQGSTE